MKDTNRITIPFLAFLAFLGVLPECYLAFWACNQQIIGKC